MILSNRFKGLAFILAFVAASVQLQAQNKMLTMKDAIINPALQPENLRQLNWVAGSEDYTFIKQSNGEQMLVRGNAGTGKQSEALSLSKLSSALEAAGAKKLTGFPAVQWTDVNTMVLNTQNTIYHYNLNTGKATAVTKYTSEAENSELDPTLQRVAYTNGNNLYVSAPGAADVAVTNEANEGIVNGQAAHRSEFGITKGTFWSPNGKQLAFYRMDQSMVTDYPLVDVAPLPAKQNAIKYPMAGGKSHHVTVGVYNLDTKATTYLKTGEPAEQYLTNITWSPDGKHIYIAVVNRDQNHMKLNQYEAATGNFVKTLLEEKHEKYVEPEHGLYFVPGKANQFVRVSERTGFDHLYLYDTNGKEIRTLTKGNWMVTDILGFNQKGDELYFTSTAESPLERHIYSVNLNNGKSKRISQEKGTHNASLSPTGKYIIDNFSNQTTPRRIAILTNNGKVAQTLLTAKNPLTDYNLGEAAMVTLKAEDGTDLYGRMITPPNMDKNKKYPVVVYVYGGPHVQLVTNNWLAGANLWMHLMAQKGYIVFTLDSRGSGNRGLSFEQAMFRQMGTPEVADQLKGVDYLKSLPYVDANRMGVHGWSYGGFMTTSLMTRTPDVFKVGVAGGPVIDWKYYEVMYTERYMDSPEQNPEGYEKANLLNHVQNLKGKLLMIHGTVDDVVVWQHSLQYLKTAVDKGILLDYFVYPGHPHNVRGKDRVHLMRKVTQYFDENLKVTEASL
ncbi:dipeptidyl-peptidase-4 [Pontibacter aydingkolensis]|uniref:S9 family peptidase n=1 Tax=Pontibacter aydingkolensis TaxID=1911536 RepID=A0ABS7CYQ5_9BACT|nr:S9 family peptidase [Pontibacter aydingkolensis]MBW7468964.1 S9 family peptidase [Pontibacter aydingkolensis]